MFFEQIGGSSQLSTGINSLTSLYGELFSRHSDRDMPRLKFSNAIQEGKLMANDYPGVLLLLVVVMNSSEGRKVLGGRTAGKLSEVGGLDDWIMLVEMLLMWELWLKSDKIALSHLKRAQHKHWYLMYLIRKVGNRRSGMGLKIVKFHAITHMADDIINFGVPKTFNTESDESAHKPAKEAAKVTQKRKETFDFQVAKRLTEVHPLELAI
jgi:hypothetical protein